MKINRQFLIFNSLYVKYKNLLIIKYSEVSQNATAYATENNIEILIMHETNKILYI